MATEELEQRIEALENQVKDLQTEVRQRQIDAAYVYIFSSWSLIRLWLMRAQDKSGEGSEVFGRAKNAEELIHNRISRHLRQVRLEPKPMDAAFRWGIETTATLQQNGYTFFDSA